jgi:phosphoribosylamine--glycine ligase
MEKYNIPTAKSRTFTLDTLEDGIKYLEQHALPVVLKADGLAAGKGVLICATLEEAQEELRLMLADAKFGDASSKVVIEEFLTGIELSVFVLSDGKDYIILPEAKDYKRIGEGDTGLNTGGMGSVSPVPFADEVFLNKVKERVVIPTVNGLKSEGIDYRGFIFVGLISVNGEPFVIEYNCRMGDPETESVFLRIESDIVEMLNAVAKQDIANYSLKISEKTAATIVVVSAGYPGDFIKGKAISGIENVEDSIVFHAGTELEDGVVKTNGGRVLTVSTLQPDIFSALQQATADAGRIYFDGATFRKDIGFDLI